MNTAVAAAPPLTAVPPASLAARYAGVRARTVALAAPLSAEDAMVQSMADASPAKWHLAHTTWFFERFVLATRPGYAPIDADWHYLFNSYYQSIGPAHARPQRGLLSRPSLDEVLHFRAEIDQRVITALQAGSLSEQAQHQLLLGLHHEQQHQELLLTDIKHAFWSNPLQPAYREDLAVVPARALPLRWLSSPERIVEIGAPVWPTRPTFAYDNESPVHRVLVPAHALANRPVSNEEYRQFVQAGGYREPRWWMSEGWTLCQEQHWEAGVRSTPTHRSAISVTSKPTPTHAGRTPGCPPNSNGRPPPPAGRCGVASPIPITSTRAGRRKKAISSSCLAMSGNGPAAPTGRIPASAPSRATSVSTTANSCAGSGCCAEAAAPPRPITCAPATAISSRRRPGGSSPACAWPGMPHEFGP